MPAHADEAVSSSVSAELIAALAKAQGEFPAIAKDKTATVRGTSKGGKDYAYEYAFADLADVLKAVRGALSSNGLALIQRPSVDSNASPPVVTVETILAHESGAKLSSELGMPLPDSSIQALGSALTYLRRYSLLALLGVAPEGEDDDGAGAQPNRAPGGSEPSESPALVSDAQVRLIWTKAREKARETVTGEDAQDMANTIVRQALASLQIEHTRDLERSQVDRVLTSIDEFMF